MHPGGQALEEYALNRLPNAQLALIEQHLLACDDCCAEVRLVDDMIAVLRDYCGCCN